MKKRKDGRYQKSKTINGKRIVFYSSESTERKAIRDIENQMLAYSQKEELGKTFGEVAEEWEESHYKNLEWQTERRYKSMVLHLLDGFKSVKGFKKEYIKSISTKDIENFFEEMVRLKYSTKSLKDQMSVTKMIFKFAIIKGYIEKNVTEYLSPPKGTPKTVRQCLNDKEIKIVQDNTKNNFGLLAYFMMYTGLRKGEALALTYADIDRKNNVISVTKSIEHYGDMPRVKMPKTEAGTRSVPLLDVVKKVLPKGKKNQIVFSENGNYMRNSYFNRCWKNYCDETGLKITSHQLRHTFATLLYEWEIDVKDSQELLGHSDISTTRNIYTHIRQSRITDTTNRINAKLQNAVNA